VKKKTEKGERKEEKEKTKKEDNDEGKKVAEEWEIWNKEEVAKLEKEVKKLVLKHFHKWIHMFGKKQSERMPIRKL